MTTINFEYTDYLQSIHPLASVMAQYSVMADVLADADTETERVTITSIMFKLCTLKSETHYETLPVPVFGNSKDNNKLLSIFHEIALEAYETQQRANQTA